MILKEYPLSGGQIEVCGTISYASQDPWLFPATVKQNILFGQTLDDRRYEKVIEVCCLVPDFEVLPYGDHTIVLGKLLTALKKRFMLGLNRWRSKSEQRTTG